MNVYACICVYVYIYIYVCVCIICVCVMYLIKFYEVCFFFLIVYLVNIFPSIIMHWPLINAVNIYLLTFTCNFFSGFQIHLRECGLPRGLIKSNRGNRLHILFNQSEVHANNFAVFEKYISSVCPKDIDFLKELEQNYKSKEAHEQIQALALFNVLFSAPWIQHFYRDSTTTYSHMDAFIKVRTCKIIDFPLLLLAVFRNRLS